MYFLSVSVSLSVEKGCLDGECYPCDSGLSEPREGTDIAGGSSFVGSHSDLKTGSAWVAAVGRVMGGIFVTSWAAAAEPSPAGNCGIGREAGMWAGCQARCSLPPMPSTRKGAELQSLGVLLTELGDIVFPEPDSRAPEWNIRPNPSGPRGRGSWRDGKSSTSRIPPAMGPWVYHSPLWAPIFLHKLVGQAKKMKPPEGQPFFPWIL